MSENDAKSLIGKIWVSVAAGIILLVGTSLFGQYWTAQETKQRSIRNEERVESLEQIKEDKEDNLEMHRYLREQSDKNSQQIVVTKKSIEKAIDKQDKQYQFIVEKLMEIQNSVNDH